MAETSNNFKNYYQILGLNPNSTLGQIENAYQRLALKWHPDKHTADRKLAQRKFQEVSEAFDILSDPNKRSTYDEVLNKKTSLENAYKTFDQFFGENQIVDENEEKFFQSHYPEKKKNYYRVLGVNKNATQEEINQAYRKMALKYHPKNNPNDEQAKRKFIEVNQAYNTLSNQMRRVNYDDFMFGEIIPRRAHDIFEEFFENKWMDLPSEQDFFRPIFDRRNRMLTGLGSRWTSPMMDIQKDMDKQWKNIKDGESYYRQEKYEKKNGKENHVAQTIKRKVKGDDVEQEVLKENWLPNGQRDVTRTVKKGGKEDTKTYHLRGNENLPREITNF